MDRLARRLLLGVLILTASAAGACPSDCNDDGRVDIGELIVALRIALADADIAACPAADQNGDATVELGELIFGTYAALIGCSTGIVSVRVDDVSTRQPWPGIHVSIAGTTHNATTDEHGQAIFALPAGDYFVDAQVCCSGPSNIDFHVPVTVTRAETTEVTLNGCSICFCASPDTPIATPWGETPLHFLAVGGLVWSIDGQQIAAVPILQTNRVAVENHTVMRIELANGSTLKISPGHPTADGRFIGDLKPGDILGGVAIIGAELVPYGSTHTYDILPASDSGVYFAGGVPIGSTLHRRWAGMGSISNPFR